MASSPASHPARRAGERGPIRLIWGLRHDLVMIAVAAVVVIALHGQSNLLGKVQQGRQAGIAVTCAVNSAVIDAGRAILTGPSQQPETPFQRRLEQLGYPPHRVRAEQARAAARMYAERIAEAVTQAAHGDAAGVVRRDGSLNCARLQAVSHTSH